MTRLQQPFYSQLESPAPVRTDRKILLFARTIALPDTSYYNLAPNTTLDGVSFYTDGQPAIELLVAVSAPSTLRVRFRPAVAGGWTFTDWLIDGFYPLGFQATTTPALDTIGSIQLAVHHRVIECIGDEMNIAIKADSGTDNLAHIVAWSLQR